MPQFGEIVVHDVRVGGVSFDKVLMILFGRVKRLKWDHLSHNRMPEHMSLIELLDVSLGHLLLLGAYVEDCRTILRALVRPLAVQFRGVVGNGEKDLQQLPVSDARRVVRDPYGFGVPVSARAHRLIMSGGLADSGKARHHTLPAL